MSKLRTVIHHEYNTIVRQPAFWIAMTLIPLLIGLVLGLTYIGNESSENRIEQLAKDIKDVAIIDHSGLINKDVVTGSNLILSSPSDFDTLREKVKREEISGLVVYPKNLVETRTYDLYVGNNDFTLTSTLGSLASTILSTSLYLPLGDAKLITLAKEGGEANITTFKNGEATAGFNEYVVPGLFVVLFYIIFAFSVGYMLSSVGEEKENRSIEMLLTYTRPQDVIVGKLLAVSLIALTQVAFFGVLAAIGLVIMTAIGKAPQLPLGIQLDQLVYNPVSIFFAASFLIVGFLMFAGFMTATAAATTSTKEANNFSTVFFLGAFIPFYFIMMIISDPENPVVRFLTFFPLTSPVVTLLRNTVGNMSTLEASLALITMCIFTALTLVIAVRAFRHGALQYSHRLSLSMLFKK